MACVVLVWRRLAGDGPEGEPSSCTDCFGPRPTKSSTSPSMSPPLRRCASEETEQMSAPDIDLNTVTDRSNDFEPNSVPNSIRGSDDEAELQARRPKANLFDTRNLIAPENERSVSQVVSSGLLAVNSANTNLSVSTAVSSSRSKPTTPSALSPSRSKPATPSGRDSALLNSVVVGAEGIMEIRDVPRNPAGVDGVLHVKVIECVNLKGWGVFAEKVRPVVRLSVGENVQFTRKYRGKNPRINENFSFKVKSEGFPEIRIHVANQSKDKQKFFLIGKIRINFETVIEKPEGSTEDYDLFRTHEQTGIIRLFCRFEPKKQST